MIGIMWFESGKDITTAARIEHAALRFREKHGLEPNVAWVPPDEKPAEPVGTIQVICKKIIMKNNVFVGVDG